MRCCCSFPHAESITLKQNNVNSWILCYCDTSRVSLCTTETFSYTCSLCRVTDVLDLKLKTCFPFLVVTMRTLLTEGMFSCISLNTCRSLAQPNELNQPKLQSGVCLNQTGPLAVTLTDCCYCMLATSSVLSPYFTVLYPCVLFFIALAYR